MPGCLEVAELLCCGIDIHSGHARKQNPTISSSGKRLGRPPAEDTFEYGIRNEKEVQMLKKHIKKYSAQFMVLGQRDCCFFAENLNLLVPVLNLINNVSMVTIQLEMKENISVYSLWLSQE